jgi:hypothetical protein
MSESQVVGKALTFRVEVAARPSEESVTGTWTSLAYPPALSTDCIFCTEPSPTPMLSV